MYSHPLKGSQGLILATPICILSGCQGMLKILKSQQTPGSRGKSKSRNGSRCGSHGNNISAWTGTEGANSMRWEERGRDSPVVNQHLPLKEDHSARVCCCVCV